MHKIDDNLHKVTARIAQAALTAERDPRSVRLIAVSKTQPPAALEQAYRAGQRCFGENYVQEALEKKSQLAHLSDIEWHFIGPIQSNKTRLIADHFAWVHSIDREKIARRLSEQRRTELPPLQVCIQVNIDDEATKAGVSLQELPALIKTVAELPGLQLRGLMTIPAPGDDPQQHAAAFKRLHAALMELNAMGLPGLDTLSMGMSADLEIAIANGATLVRIGTDIFGARDYSALTG